MMGSPLYAFLAAIGMLIGALYWLRAAKSDGRLPLIYLGGLVGALIGAKLAYLFAEGWLHLQNPNRWVIWLSGKSVMGALPGGWAGVEIVKKALGYTAITGDRFARLIPIPLILGRIGCLHAGCCLGIACPWGVWPAVAVEITFQAAMLLALLFLKALNLISGQHFHLYLFCYGIFRFFHEFLRATPKNLLGFSGYQWIALGTAAAAAIAFRKRRARGTCLPPPASPPA